MLLFFFMLVFIDSPLPVKVFNFRVFAYFLRKFLLFSSHLGKFIENLYWVCWKMGFVAFKGLS